MEPEKQGVVSDATTDDIDIIQGWTKSVARDRPGPTRPIGISENKIFLEIEMVVTCRII